MKTSGIGLWYGYDMSNRAVLEDLLKDQWYDDEVTPEEFISGEREIPRSVIKRTLPVTLEAMHEHWTPFGGYDMNILAHIFKEVDQATGRITRNIFNEGKKAGKRLIKKVLVKAHRRRGKVVKKHTRKVVTVARQRNYMRNGQAGRSTRKRI